MEKLPKDVKLLSDFIYDYPEVAVDMLNKAGFSIEKKTATLPQINRILFETLHFLSNVIYS